MKLAVSTYALSRWRSENNKTLEDSLRWIADARVGAVEFTGFGEVPDSALVKRAAELRGLCEKLKLNIVGYCIGAELLVPAGKQRDAVDKLKLHIDAAAELGVASMRHDVTRGWGENAAGIDLE